MDFLRALWNNRVLLEILLPPLIFLFIPLVYCSPAANCGYLLMVMICYWLTECIPSAITGILPAVFLPLCGIVRAVDLAPCYMRDIMMTFIGSIAIAAMLENSNLHKRIALKTLLIFGVKPVMLQFGVMLITWFCSMWISNTAAAVLMMTILDALVKQFEKHALSEHDACTAMLTASELKLSAIDDSIAKSRSCTSALNRPMTTGSDSHELHLAPRRMRFSVTTQHSACTESTSINDEKSIFDDESHIVKVESVDPLPKPAVEKPKKSKSLKDLRKMLGLSVCYSASCGGIATLTGTPTNLILVGQLQKSFNSTGKLNFASWMVLAMPLSLLMIAAAFIWLQICFFGFASVWHGTKKHVRRMFCCFGGKSTQYGAVDLNELSAVKKRKDHAKGMLKLDYKELGPFSVREILTSIYFFILVILWLMREPGSFGWGFWFRPGYITDSLPALVVLLLGGCTPVSFYKSGKIVDGKPEKAVKVQFLITWKDIQRNTPWDFIFLVGGGFAVSEGCKVSGLASLVGTTLRFLGDLPVPTLIILTLIISASLTTVSSNVAVCSILLPLLADLSIHMRVNPLIVMLPAALAASFAFLLPVSTPPNAVVYSKGYVKSGDMIKCGFVMSLLCILLTVLCMFTYMDWYLDLTDATVYTFNRTESSNGTIA